MLNTVTLLLVGVYKKKELEKKRAEGEGRKGNTQLPNKQTDV